MLKSCAGLRTTFACTKAVRSLPHYSSRQIVVVSMAADPHDALCVHAATDAALSTAKMRASDAGPILAPQKPGSDGHTACSLSFHFPSSSSYPPHCGSFNPAEFFSRLRTNSLGSVLITARATKSTQAIIQDNITRLPDGTVFIADRQTTGKGRGGNVWESPEGCLMFSMCRRLVISGQRLPFVQYLVTLAVVQAAQYEAAAVVEAVGASENVGATCLPPPLELRIKWPNDVYVGDLKMGGVLCHSSFRDGAFNVTMGVGFNVSNAAPTTCLDGLIQEKAARSNLPTPPRVQRERLLAGVLTRLEPMLDVLASQGFEPFEKDYYGAWMHSGQRVEVESGDESSERVVVTIIGLSSHGYLLAEDDHGRKHELHPDGNSLDFLKGLVRRKLPA